MDIIQRAAQNTVSKDLVELYYLMFPDKENTEKSAEELEQMKLTIREIFNSQSMSLKDSFEVLTSMDLLKY